MGCGTSRGVYIEEEVKNTRPKQSKTDLRDLGLSVVLTERQISLVQDTWKLITADQKRIALIFYLKLFTLNPVFQQMFTFYTEDEVTLQEDERYLFQSRRFFEMINAAIERLDDVSLLILILTSLGETHQRKLNVKPEYYKPVGEALIFAIGKGLGSLHTDEIKAAWEAVYALISDAMIKGAHKAQLK